MTSLFGGLGPTIDKNAVKINNMKKAIFVVLILIIIFIIYAY